MGKKIWYSVPLKYYWNGLYATQKKYTPEFTDEQIFKVLRHNLFHAPLKADESQASRELIVSGLELWREDAKGELLHIFFLDNELRDFLEKTPLSDLDGVRQYLFDNGKNKTMVYLKSNRTAQCVVYNFGLHIPYENDGYAFSLCLYEDGTIELYNSRGAYSGRMSDSMYKDVNKKNDRASTMLAKMFRLTINTIAYMRCFPECVSEGVPKIANERNEIRSDNNVVFKMSDKVIDLEVAPRSKTPHFRKGFFKLLRSDYYTHKKGQLVYVAETMVKGKAKTVATAEELDKFTSDHNRDA